MNYPIAVYDDQPDSGIPEGFYSLWNLAPDDIKKCSVYELLRVSRIGLDAQVYKAFETTKDIDGKETKEFKFHLLHKGQAFEIVWQFESFQAYVLRHTWPDSTEFIISLRKCGEASLALVQRRRDKR